MTDPNLLGFGQPVPGYAPTCGAQTDNGNYGPGIRRSGSWLWYSPPVSGVSATEAYLPSEKIAIAVAVTYLKASDLESLERGPTATCPLVGGTSTRPTRGRGPASSALGPRSETLGESLDDSSSCPRIPERVAESARPPDHHIDGTHAPSMPTATCVQS